MSLEAKIHLVGKQALLASRALALLSSEEKNLILEAMAKELEDDRDQIIDANKKDLFNAAEKGLTGAMLDRLTLTDDRFENMVTGVRHVTSLPDPVGSEIKAWTQPNGIDISKIRVPIGVIGIIYESRPNVTADASVLCFKTSNAVILRGGSEAFHSNQAIARSLQSGGEKAGLPPHSIQLLQTTDRAAIKPLVRMDEYLDLIIPRGGEGLIRFVTENATVPVIKHYDGICHVYVDKAADTKMALDIIENGKCQRPGVCNAVETVLVHQQIAAEFLPELKARLADVEIRGDATSQAILHGISSATEQDWKTEYLDLILSLKVVEDLADATLHINTYGSKHSDAIISQDAEAQKAFIANVDTAAVFVNASTRFNDGGEFGFGAEIGISTDKLHARGPMGLEELTTYKYVVTGTGQIRA